MFHNPGEFSMQLPVGEAELTFVKGFEFFPQTVSIEIQEGEVSSLNVELERLTDMGAKGGSALQPMCTQTMPAIFIIPLRT